MDNYFFWDDEHIVGRPGFILKDVLSWECEYEEDEELKNELAEQLERADENNIDYVLCWYHPMGAWLVYELKEGDRV